MPPVCALTESADGINNGAVLWLHINITARELRAAGRAALLPFRFESKMPPVANCDVSSVALSFIQTRNEALSQSHHALLFGVMTKKAAEVCA